MRMTEICTGKDKALLKSLARRAKITFMVALGMTCTCAACFGLWFLWGILTCPSGILILRDDGKVSIDGRVFAVEDSYRCLHDMTSAGRREICVVGGANWLHRDVRRARDIIAQNPFSKMKFSPVDVKCFEEGIEVLFFHPRVDFELRRFYTNLVPFNVHISTHGTMIAGETVDTNRCAELLKVSRERAPSGIYAVIECEQASRHRALLELLASVKSSGVDRIYVITDEKQ